MDNPSFAEATEPKLERCGHCRSANLQQHEKGPHLGLYCADCGAWIRWIPRHARLKLAEPKLTAQGAQPLAEAAPKKIDPKRIAHPVTLEDRVSSLEHDLGIIAQILVGRRQAG